jgi:hypothetical protein
MKETVNLCTQCHREDLLCHVAVGIDCSYESRLELVHSGVGEEERGIVQRDGGRGVNVDVLKNIFVLVKNITNFTYSRTVSTGNP